MQARSRFPNVSILTKARTILAHVFWPVREKVIKTVLLWQIRNMEFSYRLWRWRHARTARNRSANIPNSSGALLKPGEPLICVNIFLCEGDRPEDLQQTLLSLKNQECPAWQAAVYIPVEWEQTKKTAFLPVWQDPRIRTFPCLETQKDNLYQISLERAAGEWVCWTRTGGRFAPDAFTEMLCQVERCPDF